MNNKSGSERELTHPRGACDECDFPYSYDPTDGGTVCVRCLKEKRDHLQKLCEEQKAKLSLLRDLVLDDIPHQYQSRLLEVLK